MGGLWYFGAMWELCNCQSSPENLNRSVESKSETTAEPLCLDISSVKKLSYGSKKFWLLILDDCTEQSWSEFLERKNQTEKKTIALILKTWKPNMAKLLSTSIVTTREKTGSRVSTWRFGYSIWIHCTWNTATEWKSWTKVHNSLCQRKSHVEPYKVDGNLEKRIVGWSSSYSYFNWKCVGDQKSSHGTAFDVLRKRTQVHPKLMNSIIHWVSSTAS